MNKFAFALDSLGTHQIACSAIMSVNRFLATEYKYDISMFYDNFSKHVIPCNFMTLPLTEAFDYNGPIIFTNFSLVEKILRIPTTTKKIWYMYDLEWIYMQNRLVSELSSIYRNTNLQIITRNKDYADVIKYVWDRDAAIVGDFDIGEIWKATLSNNMC